ncbi:MAG: hypothetical protein U1D99_07975, partial [Candidatus Omnitrophota bacterium]|nr:hypothetical protein [Candidatus Omnitrophota bacterium]
MAQRIRGFGLFLMLTALTLWVPTEALAGGGKEGFRERVQKKISTQQSNIQYEPYYLQTDYQVRKDEAAPQQQAAPAMMGMDGGASGAAGQNLRAGGYQTSNYNAALASTVVATAAVVPAISRYAIYQTEYTAELEDNVVTVNGKVVFEVFEKGWTQLPLVKSNVGLINVSVNRGAAFVTMQGGKYYLMVDKPGRYTLNVEFLIKASRERERGPGHFNFDVMPAPISQFEFIIPETGVEIFVDPAIKVEVKKDADKTSAWAVMPNTNSITARWTKALPKEEIAPVKMEPKVYADTATYVSVGEGIIRSQTTVSYSILQSEVSTFRISIPEDVSLLDVQGSELRDWKVSKADGVQYLDVYLNFGIKGNYVLTMTYERNIGEGSVVADIPWVKATGVERENGFFG